MNNSQLKLPAHFKQREDALIHLRAMIKLAKAATEIAERVSPGSQQTHVLDVRAAEAFADDLSTELLAESFKLTNEAAAAPASRSHSEGGSSLPEKNTSPEKSMRPEDALGAVTSILTAARPLLDVLSELSSRRK